MTAIASKEVEKILEVVAALDRRRVSVEDFQSVAQILTEYAKATRLLTEQELTKIREVVNKLATQLKDENGQSLLETKQVVEKRLNGAVATMNKEMMHMSSEHQQAINYLYDRVARIKDGETPTATELLNLIRPLIPQVKDGEDADPKVVAELVQKELQPKIEEIDKLKKEVEELKKRPIGRTGARKIPMIRVENLTSQVDGATKSFTMPRDTVRVLGVFGTQFPIIFDPAVDFTLSGQTLTLGSAVSAPASGQTLFALIETLFYA